MSSSRTDVSENDTLMKEIIKGNEAFVLNWVDNGLMADGLKLADRLQKPIDSHRNVLEIAACAHQAGLVRELVNRGGVIGYEILEWLPYLPKEIKEALIGAEINNMKDHGAEFIVKSRLSAALWELFCYDRNGEFIENENDLTTLKLIVSAFPGYYYSCMRSHFPHAARLRPVGNQYMTPLTFAIAGCSAKTVRFLLDKQKHLNCLPCDAIFIACQNTSARDLEVLQLVIDQLGLAMNPEENTRQVKIVLSSKNSPQQKLHILECLLKMPVNWKKASGDLLITAFKCCPEAIPLLVRPLLDRIATSSFTDELLDFVLESGKNVDFDKFCQAIEGSLGSARSSARFIERVEAYMLQCQLPESYAHVQERVALRKQAREHSVVTLMQVAGGNPLIAKKEPPLAPEIPPSSQPTEAPRSMSC